MTWLTDCFPWPMMAKAARQSAHRRVRRYFLNLGLTATQCGTRTAVQSSRQITGDISKWPPRALSAGLMALEILNGAFPFLRRTFCLESAEIPSFSRFWIFLARIQPILSGFQLPDHVPSTIRKRSGLRALNLNWRATASVAELRPRSGTPDL